MREFKVGDVVRCIDRTYPIEREFVIYKVEAHTDDGQTLVFLDPSRPTHGFYAFRFELVHPSPLDDDQFYDETPEIAEIRAAFIAEEK